MFTDGNALLQICILHKERLLQEAPGCPITLNITINWQGGGSFEGIRNYKFHGTTTLRPSTK